MKLLPIVCEVSELLSQIPGYFFSSGALQFRAQRWSSVIARDNVLCHRTVHRVFGQRITKEKARMQREHATVTSIPESQADVKRVKNDPDDMTESLRLDIDNHCRIV